MEKFLSVPDVAGVMNVFGSYDSNIKIIENNYSVKIVNRDTEIKVTGEDAENVSLAAVVMENLIKLALSGSVIDEQNVRYMISMAQDGCADSFVAADKNCVCITARGKPVKAKTMGQKKYIEAITNNTVVLAVGPAGTGKTYLAVAMAVTAFRKKEVSRIVLTRPAVEAGEKLGFLPGDLQTKIDPYLRPLHDALHEMFGVETYQKYVERGTIEIAPLAYMRGRTLDDCFIILDEAQNTTPEQMKMLLTRIGFGSKTVINGDITQIDLPRGIRSGLKEAVKILENIEGIETVMFTERDVVRHPLVQKIIKAYEKYELKKSIR